ncbi:MAG TPA: fatty-acid--CoA ligase, partial [Steroidobacteraceae bacterium]
AVIGIPHPELGEQGLALCEMKPGAARDPQAIIEHCRKSLASYKVPKLVEFVEELPRNPTGKVMKAVLREPYWAGRERKV